MQVIDQLKKLESYTTSFSSHLNAVRKHDRLSASGLSIFQINVGKLCNQACKHCHVDAGPSRTELMSLKTIDLCLKIIAELNIIKTVDITGGAPEMNPHFQYLVEECKAAGKHVIDRCNLTILEKEGYEYLYSFLSKNSVEIIASLPHYNASDTDKQRGTGVYDKSINALKKLNQLGYGEKIPLNLVYNPVGVHLAGAQETLEQEFKENLYSQHGIIFNNLYCINNMPIHRYLEALIRSNQFESYMNTLVNAFNPCTVGNLMCREQISVSWDGHIYDCDFNQMLDVKSEPIFNLQTFNHEAFISRNIQTANHCFGCTAGAGSSCSGELA